MIRWEAALEILVKERGCERTISLNVLKRWVQDEANFESTDSIRWFSVETSKKGIDHSEVHGSASTMETPWKHPIYQSEIIDPFRKIR